MARISKSTPLKHETAREKKKRLRHAEHDSQALDTLTGLKRRTYQPPPIPQNHSQPSSTTLEDFGQWDDNQHSEHNDFHAEGPPDGTLVSSLVDSVWDSIPWEVKSSSNSANPNRGLFLDPQITASIREHDRNTIHNSQQDNWKKCMTKLFSSYLWLKDKTENWTAECSFDPFTSRFCKCKDDSPRFKQKIDLVDLNGQERMEYSFCRCMPRSVQLLTIGFLPSSPVQPTVGFSMRLLAYHNYAWHHSNVRIQPFTETHRLFNEERSQVLWNHSKTAGRDLKQCLSSSVLVYRELLKMNVDLIQTALDLNNTQKLASGTCPACFGPSSNTGLNRLSSVKNKLIVSLDGNFQHRHQKLAARNTEPLITPDIFIQPSKLSDLKLYISAQELLHKVPRKANKCADTHKAGNDSRNETTWKSCDDTGVMGSCCRHDSVIYLANIHGTGENRALPLVILKRLLENIESDRPVGVLYDLGCSLDKFVNLRSIFPESRSRITFGTSVFHAYVHEWPCQLKYNPRYQKGWGLSDGESLERLWSSLSSQISPLRYASRNNRLGALAHRCTYRNKQSIAKLAAWLRSKFDQALVRRDTEKAVLTELLQMINPHNNQAYSIDFFRSQWEDQVRVGLQQDDIEEASKKTLAEFFENEDIINAYQDRLIWGTLPATLGEANEILDSIDTRVEAQRQLAVSIGKDYEELRQARQAEFGMLSVLWKAKSELYAQAVKVRAERQPLQKAQSGNIAGTRLKEKILAAGNRRKGPVERAIKNFNDRRRQYLTKFNPSQLLLPENRDLSYSDFLAMDLDDPLWNDGHFYHARAPWALDPNVRKGVKSVLFLDRVEEEIELLTQELDRMITWAYQYRSSILSTISLLETESQEPIDMNNRFAQILTIFPMKSKLRLLRSELKAHLLAHEKLMLSWMLDVETLWNQTRSRHTKANHPWFEVISSIKD
ncbi:hypothetical protein PGT21_020031 [Puccinia graminis f. sp. tritici]|uniref:CxC1-like cysteine cluster associated with KDZ transposases domain-containing protein n=1 Tax=Puccinia graminis f. sp. tritici TaxID=56615 RepID=A0A5B0NWS0_PUCGR|nr:hypothetical protein PGT21_020031 [Puccinia graminis f. sp. tritici]